MVSGRHPPWQRPPGPAAQDGAFAIMFVPLLVLLVAFAGLAMDMGMVYNRKVELSGMAKAAALAAAKELNGKSSGITAAKTRAREAAQRFTYRYGNTIEWDDAALSFGTTPARGGDWVGAGGVANAAGYFYAKVDTAALDAVDASISTIFMRVLSSSLATIDVADVAIAGRSGIQAVPLAVCAMSETAASARINTGLTNHELIEYGFRRGVSYDLMQLNPRGTVAARYVINPVVPPGMPSTSFNTGILGPFVCAANLWMPRLTGDAIRVSSMAPAAPLAGLATQLNSRFDDFGQNLCFPAGAPPDYNIRAYTYETAGGAPWMSPATGLPAAMTTTERDRLETVADIPPPGSTRSGVNAGSFGPLWSYAKAVRYSSYSAGTPEPSGGYTPFSTGDWPKLYRADIAAVNYPGSGQSSPYNPENIMDPPTLLSPAQARREYATQLRRVLYVPLLSCATEAPSGNNVPATVLAVGKFFMTVPATSNTLIAEFAGIAAEQSIPASVELYP
ncbi:pilus assembly protein TadG-related protein [Massilia oculi]|uniref:pilus assembly protein TadG-related protein n=1 Tax=Massilia oculi TaxID=945844 RepID=UPI0028A5BBD7|nr:pilus assembly protein TadG-related protein [Massilia oculi]